MIPVTPQPEPADFDIKVRQPGLAWLVKEAIALDKVLAPNTEIKPFWRGCLDELYSRYHCTCAYLAVHLERATGNTSVDHFIPKSKRPDLAYEWQNYRLASNIMNSRKRDYADVLDPFEDESGWFHLELLSGRIYPNPALDLALQTRIANTIARLGLDDGCNREMRARHYQEFMQKMYSADYLAQRSPLVYAEAQRQNMLQTLVFLPQSIR